MGNMFEDFARAASETVLFHGGRMEPAGEVRDWRWLWLRKRTQYVFIPSSLVTVRFVSSDDEETNQ